MIRSNLIYVTTAALTALNLQSVQAHNPLSDTVLSENAQRTLQEIRSFAPAQAFVREVPLSDGTTGTQTILLAGNAGHFERFFRRIPRIGKKEISTIFVHGRTSTASHLTQGALATVLPLSILARAGIIQYDHAATSGYRFRNHGVKLNAPTPGNLKSAWISGGILAYLGIDSIVRKVSPLESSESWTSHFFPLGSWKNRSQASAVTSDINERAQDKFREDASDNELLVVIPKTVFTRVKSNLIGLGYQPQAL